MQEMPAARKGLTGVVTVLAVVYTTIASNALIPQVQGASELTLNSNRDEVCVIFGQCLQIRLELAPEFWCVESSSSQNGKGKLRRDVL